MDKDNANPTILNLSQLPTRQARKKVVPTGPGTKYHDLIFSRPAFLSSSDDESDWSAGDDLETGGDFTVDPIDEQEVYGKIVSPAPSHTCLAFASPSRWPIVSVGTLLVANRPGADLARDCLDCVSQPAWNTSSRPHDGLFLNPSLALERTVLDYRVQPWGESHG